MLWVLRIIQGASLLGLIAAAAMFVYEIFSGAFMGMAGPAWSMTLFWSSITLAGVHLCLLAVRAKRLVIPMWFSVPIAIATIGFIVALGAQLATGIQGNAEDYSRYAGSGFFFIWMLAAIGSLHRIVLPGKHLFLVRALTDLFIVLALAAVLTLIWWMPINEHLLGTSELRAERTLEGAMRITAAIAIVAVVMCITLIVIAKRRELTGEGESAVAERIDFNAVCPRCATRSTLQTGGDICPTCRLRITVKPV